MKKIVKLNENDLTRIVKRVMNEQLLDVGVGGPSKEGVRNIFKACTTKGMGKSTMNGGLLDGIADNVFRAIDGAGTYEEPLSKALMKIVTIPDLCAVNKRYGENHPGRDLFSDLDGDIDSDSEWNQYVYRPLLNALRKTRELTAKAKVVNKPIVKPTQGSVGIRPTVKPTQGTVGRIVKEQDDQRGGLYSDINNLINEKYSDINPSDVVDVLENILRNSKAIHYRRKNNIGSLTKDEVLKNFKR